MKIGEAFNPRNTFVGLFIPEALAASTAISSTAKLAYGHLVRRAGENGHCWPAAADVAKYTGVGERAAQRALKELQAGEYPLIRATFRRDEKGRQITNDYVFIWGPILEKSCPVKNDTLPQSKTTPSGASVMTGTGTSKTTPEKCQKKSNTGKVSDEDEATPTPTVLPSNEKPDNPERPERWSTREDERTAGELSELLPDWLDAEAQRRIWQGCRRFATDCTPVEVAAAVQDKIHLLGKKTNPGLLITSVPWMFEGSRGFHLRFRRRAGEQAAVLANAKHTSHFEEEEYNQAAEPQQPQSPQPEPELPCEICSGFGIVGELAAACWCKCPAGAAREAKEPDAIEKQHRAAKMSAYSAARSSDARKVGFQRAADVARDFERPRCRSCVTMTKNLHLSQAPAAAPSTLAFQDGLADVRETISARLTGPGGGLQRFESAAGIDPRPPQRELASLHEISTAAAAGVR